MGNKQSKKTKSKFKKALMEIYATKPFWKITITEVCEKVDLSRTTFYAHYNNLDDLLREIETDLLTEISQLTIAWDNYTFTSPDLSIETDKQTTITLLKFFQENKTFLLPLLSENGDPYFINRYKKMMYDLFLIGGILATTIEWLKTEDLSAEEMALSFMIFTTGNPSLIDFNTSN